MLVLDRQSVAAHRPGSKPPVQLRFRATGQLVELPIGKTTIGSSPRCNLRIQEPGVQPVHCLIVRDAEGLTVRRWAANTLLNGAAFDEAPLAEGDCLTVCNVELELLPTRPVEAQTTRWMPQSNELNDDLLDTMQESVDAMAELDDSPVATETLLLEYDRSVRSVADAQPLEPAAEFEAIAESLASVDEPTVIDDEPTEARLADGGELRAGVEEFYALAPGSAGGLKLHNNLPHLQTPAEPWATDDSDSEQLELHASEAAEIVFQELQSASANSRARSRKLLAALRAKQEDYSELAERLSDVEAQLAELRKLRNEWDETQFGHEAERREWETQLHDLRRQLCECEVRLAEHAQQVAELRVELAAVRSSESAIEEPCKVATDESESPSPSQVVDWLPVSMAPHASVREVASEIEPLAGVDESNRLHSPEAEESHVPSVPQPAKAWDIPVAADAWPAARSEGTEQEHVTPVADEPIGEESAVVDQAAGKAEPIKATLEPTEELVTEAEVENPFAQFSIWKQGVLLDAPNHSEPADIVPSEAPKAAVPVVEQPNSGAAVKEETSAKVAEATRPKPQQASFIDRYSHMFGEEGAEASAPAAPVQQTPVPVVINSPPREVGIARSVVAEPKSTLSNDEESIEQYMAKLLERVRRDAPAGASSQAPPATAEELAAEKAAAEAAGLPQRIEAAKSEASQSEPSEPMSEADAEREIATWHAGDRKPTAPASDLGALRAIANQTARRAIGRHQLAKHKRVATTKVIVSTLAGMTSLWLMLLAPNWRDPQFIAACVGLLVAAYWASEAFRAMLRSWKAATYHGGQHDLLHDSGEHQHAGLPIDVEDRF